MIHITVSQLHASDFNNFTDAAASLSGTYTEEVRVECLDKETYDEAGIDWTGASFESGGWLHIVGSYDGSGRTTLTNSSFESNIFYMHNRVEVEGIKFDISASYDHTVKSIVCISFDSPNTTYSKIHECQFFGNGIYRAQLSPTYYERGTIAVYWGDVADPTDEKYFYNNLVDNMGYYAAELKEGSVAYFYNNTFARNKQVLYWHGSVNSDAKIWNNIFITDPSYHDSIAPWDVKFSVMQQIDDYWPDDFGFVDYNLYQFLNRESATGKCYIWTRYWDDELSLIDLNELQSKYPGSEINGLEEDPLLLDYPIDFHIVDSNSPALSSGYSVIPSIDNDGDSRGTDLDIGCYKLMDIVEYFFVGDTDSSWADSDNWSNTSGGVGGFGVPGEMNRAVFDLNSPDCTVDTDVDCLEIRFEDDFASSVDITNNDINVLNFRTNHGGVIKYDGSASIVVRGIFINNGTIITSVGAPFVSSAMINNGIVIPPIIEGVQRSPRANDKQVYESKLEARASIKPY